MPRLQLNIDPFNKVSRDLLNIMGTLAHFRSEQSLINGSIVSSMPYTGNCCRNCILNSPVLSESIFVSDPLHKVFGAQFQRDLHLSRMCTSHD